ncbi:MAG: prepilin-type N-terminal cleavage/methylation domain-containing protein, partial [bacterium]|nr:prepilin-type N-terminal cleavage/methylation domain-containing protein [bacterium]
KSKVKSCVSMRGFTLIETLIAIAILLLAVTGPMTLAERGLASAGVAKIELTALYLGQEALEFIRNTRDENFLRGRGGGQNWLQGLDECATVTGCAVDPTASGGNRIDQCSAGNDDCLLWQHQGDAPNERLKGLFGHPRVRGGSTANWKITSYKRKVCITRVTDTALCVNDSGNNLRNEREVKVNVLLDWTAGALGTRSAVVTTTIFNWYDSP